MPKKKNKEEKEDISGLFIPAGLFIGFGLGFMMRDFVSWMFLGLGAGFLGMAIARIFLKD